MLHIEFKKAGYNRETQEDYFSNCIIMNGIQYDGSSWKKGMTDLPRVFLYDKKAIEELKSYTFSEVGKYMEHFCYEEKTDRTEFKFNLEVNCTDYFITNPPRIVIELIDVIKDWIKPWSIPSFLREFEIAAEKLNNRKVQYYKRHYYTQDPDAFGIVYSAENFDLTIDSEIQEAISIFLNIIDSANRQLIKSLDKESILTYFQFPDEIKTACTQYLAYFSQFIADIGIAVNTELKEEINHTLFKIRPKDQNESLDKIREALMLYLHAPGDQNFRFKMSSEKDIAVKQWEANILHLQSQLALASSIIQAKESAIEMLQLSNYQYKQIIESNSKKEVKREELIKGIVSIKEYDGKGFSINFAELLKRLKRLIK